MTVAEGAALNWQIHLRRRMGDEERAEWTMMQWMLEEFTMEEREDKIAWGLSPSKTFTTSSLYKLLQSGGVELRLTKKIWQCKIPLKNKIFLWQAFQNRIQTIQQLKSKRWKGSELCYLCDRLEDINHLLFNFSLAEFVWAIFSEALGWRGQPRNLTDLLNNWLVRMCCICVV
jgi:hypothetical protein